MAAYHHMTHAAGEYSNVVNAASEIHKPTVQTRKTSRNAFFSSNALSLLILSPLQPLQSGLFSDYSSFPPCASAERLEFKLSFGVPFF
jgi:hypothetical protein